MPSLPMIIPAFAPKLFAGEACLVPTYEYTLSAIFVNPSWAAARPAGTIEKIHSISAAEKILKPLVINDFIFSPPLSFSVVK
jgi:hypothetical protein